MADAVVPPAGAVAVEVVVAAPAHSGLGEPLTYLAARPLAPGTLVRVPLGRREVLGMVWEPTATPREAPAGALRPVAEVWEALPPLDARWRALVAFAARYYQRTLGEVALAALPPALRTLSAAQLTRRLHKAARARHSAAPSTPGGQPPSVTDAQAHALAVIDTSDRPVLLFGATGSGKTEVYLQATARLLADDPEAQALVLVPEINLTPQLEQRFRARFGDAVTTLHSGLTPAQRLQHWLAAHRGQARIVLGTRTAVLASLPRLRLIVVDEEHDPSYKSQEGARYSARDLAVYRARLGADLGCRVVLGSATPALESWHAAAVGRYQRVDMAQRMGGACWPQLRLVDMRQQPRGTTLAPALLAAIEARLARGEQALVLLNRRGYAPVIACDACGWKSGCPHCSAHLVYHKGDRSLRCHHCGHAARVPRACPDCGNVDLTPIGRGTEQLEEQLALALASLRRADGSPVRIGRLDADTARAAGALEHTLEAVHSGAIDVLVGTQMIAKGHDFRRITLVASVNTDGALFASDWRAPERLFTLLMQAAGRAGRDAAFVAAQGSVVELWVQTAYPQHPLFAALARHDYAAFAAQQLHERRTAGMPPFSHQALLRAEARQLDAALAWLRHAAAAAHDLPGRPHVTLYAPVPMTMTRVAGIERAQLLLESPHRPALQALLAAWLPRLHTLRAHADTRGLVRWAIDVDPLSF
ncbi:Primosomal protein N' [Tepidimonas thermarum]|uniref:Replication restart protein PriA n=1 Tax=Tepidimonas thermarum TaxID=335431 RepID=A0A554X3X1_9BURK|nr:primosomal protein N' [Tepidimonas thermarum]TSE30540.1 Primosomal protein N' [Tepidimonas thermarum]